MCGKDLLIPTPSSCATGSPPHVRERHRHSEPKGQRPGITPACAGKTHPFYYIRRASWDHPRMCGKDTHFFHAPLHFSGSPPHVRERPWSYWFQSLRSGITPACAGKTDKETGPLLSRRDHPRMCGKDTNSSIFTRITSGSPPHVRERLNNGFINLHRDRIIPACAGKTRSGR